MTAVKVLAALTATIPCSTTQRPAAQKGAVVGHEAHPAPPSPPELSASRAESRAGSNAYVHLVIARSPTIPRAQTPYFAIFIDEPRERSDRPRRAPRRRRGHRWRHSPCRARTHL